MIKNNSENENNNLGNEYEIEYEIDNEGPKYQLFQKKTVKLYLCSGINCIWKICIPSITLFLYFYGDIFVTYNRIFTTIGVLYLYLTKISDFVNFKASVTRQKITEEGDMKENTVVNSFDIIITSIDEFFQILWGYEQLEYLFKFRNDVKRCEQNIADNLAFTTASELASKMNLDVFENMHPSRIV
jgi:hypothetical protein